MARGGTASSLLMLSLAEALLLVAGGISAAAASGDSETDIIVRLPTHVRDAGGVAGLVTAMAATAATHGGEERPWDCCDFSVCALTYPPICRCVDEVDQCSSACKQCEETEDSRRTCADWYHSHPGERFPFPKCHDDDRARHAAAAAARVTKGGGDGDEKRPWKCCNMALCTRSIPPICYCTDNVERCAITCEHCEQVEGSELYRCLDAYRGEPGPTCEEDEVKEIWAPAAVASRHHRFFQFLDMARKE